jgi:hypothetical protein
VECVQAGLCVSCSDIVHGSALLLGFEWSQPLGLAAAVVALATHVSIVCWQRLLVAWFPFSCIL